MAIEITIPPALQPLAGDMKQVAAAGHTVGECINDLIKKYPGIKSKLINRQGRLRNGINIFLNGQNVYLGPLAKTVRDGDKIHIAFTVLGG